MTRPLSGKTAVLLGDSTTATYFETALASLWDATVVNGAVGGAPWTWNTADTVYGPFSGAALAKAFRDAYAADPDAWDAQDAAALSTPALAPKLATLKGINWLNVDAVAVMLGTNDYGNNRAIGTNTDTVRNTVKGAINNFLTDMLTTYPHLKIVLVTPFYRDRFTASRSGTASVSGSTLTVVTATGGTNIAAGDSIYIEGIERRTTIPELSGTGTGGTGTYPLDRYFGGGLSTRGFVTADADNNGFTFANTAGKTLPDYADAIIEIGRLPRWAISVLDAQRESGLNPLTATRDLIDGLHFSDIGFPRAANWLGYRLEPLLAGVDPS